MNKSFYAILIGVVLIMIGVFVIGGGKESSSDVSFEGNPQEIQESDHQQGPDEPLITLIEYGDFECPACAAFYPVVGAAKEQFAEEMLYAFRHFPLTNIHPNATAAHRAAEAAGMQGQFFEMHDLLYERSAEWAAATSGISTAQAITLFENYAQSLGLDMEKYRTDAASSEVFDVITAHQESGNQLGIQATPTLLLNGEIIETPRDADAFFDLLQAAIDEAKAQQTN